MRLASVFAKLHQKQRLRKQKPEFYFEQTSSVPFDAIAVPHLLLVPDVSSSGAQRKVSICNQFLCSHCQWYPELGEASNLTWYVHEFTPACLVIPGMKLDVLFLEFFIQDRSLARSQTL